MLFEVLVAILIASTALIALLQGLGGALRGGRIAENYFKASMLAKFRLALLEKETSVKPGAGNGKFSADVDPEGIFSWQENITPIARNTALGTNELRICDASVTVSWKEKSGQRSVRLATFLQRYDESGPER